MTNEHFSAISWRQTAQVWFASVGVLCLSAGLMHVVTRAQAATHFGKYLGMH